MVLGHVVDASYAPANLGGQLSLELFAIVVIVLELLHGRGVDLLTLFLQPPFFLENLTVLAVPSDLDALFRPPQGPVSVGGLTVILHTEHLHLNVKLLAQFMVEAL